ncbi:MAG: hypothetical protein ACM3MK_06920 [Chitinophagales bacterium]
MDENPSLQSLLFNIIYSMTSTDKDRVNPHQIISILFLVNLLGILNYINQIVPNPGHKTSLEFTETNDLIPALVQMMGEKKSGGKNMNTLDLVKVLNLMSSLGSKSDDDGNKSEE